jgi:hypothetical protein
MLKSEEPIKGYVLTADDFIRAVLVSMEQGKFVSEDDVMYEPHEVHFSYEAARSMLYSKVESQIETLRKKLYLLDQKDLGGRYVYQPS